MSHSRQSYFDHCNERQLRSFIRYRNDNPGETASSQFASRDGADFVEIDPPPTFTAPSHHEYPSTPNYPIHRHSDRSGEDDIISTGHTPEPNNYEGRQFYADSGEYDHPSMQYEERMDYERRRRHRQQPTITQRYDTDSRIRDLYNLNIHQSNPYLDHTNGGVLSNAETRMDQQQQQQQQQPQIPRQQQPEGYISFSDKSYPQRGSEQPHEPNIQSAALLFKQNPVIEISPGLPARLRGASETKDAVRRDEFQPVACLNCRQDLLCMSDAAFVLCPECRVVSPLDEARDSSSNSVAQHKGVGLGFTFDTLHEIQQEIREERGTTEHEA